MSKHFRRTVRWSALIALAISASIFIAGQVARRRLVGDFAAPGRLVDVGGYRLHLHCTGTGAITVLLEAGLNEFSLHWHRVQPVLSEHARVCSYDRAGLGWSDPSPHHPTISRATADLQRLLQAAGVHPPLLLVGHSYGAIVARAYRASRPADVAGLLLVDPAHEDQAERIPRYAALLERQASLFRTLRLVSAAGVLALAPQQVPAGHLDGEALRQYRAVLAGGRFFAGAAAETQAFIQNLDAARGMELDRLGATPLVVISRGRPDPLPWLTAEENEAYERAWSELQRQIVAYSTAGRQLVAARAGHAVSLQQPEVIIDAAREMLAELGDRP